MDCSGSCCNSCSSSPCSMCPQIPSPLPSYAPCVPCLPPGCNPPILPACQRFCVSYSHVSGMLEEHPCQYTSLLGIRNRNKMWKVNNATFKQAFRKC